ncbi:MAG: TerC/Alx family metal homeostasis membrane protein [Deltaproteobacteria bacterium]|nr:TerC/Alx family metal homeostasis membrane protein [Deltaproteobacteria bacterium]
MFENSVASLKFWGGFHIVIFIMLAIDLGWQRGCKTFTTRAAIFWSVVWLATSLAFCVFVYQSFGAQPAYEWLSAYLLEKSLSVDNLFVFMLVFSTFKVETSNQHRVLFWGIFTAIVLRATMILGGVALVARFEFVLVLFGFFLLYTGGKLLLLGDDDDEDLENNRIIKLFRRFVPMTSHYDGSRFTTIVDGARKATPLLLVLVVVELSDVLFALDSIPAVFGVTRDPFLIYTSNIFAILGLRALYTLLAKVLDGLRFIAPAVALVLLFVGGKMIAGFFGIHVSTELSLGVILGLLGCGVAFSIVWNVREKKEG